MHEGITKFCPNPKLRPKCQSTLAAALYRPISISITVRDRCLILERSRWGSDLDLHNEYL